MNQNFAICNETFGDWELARATRFAKEAGYSGWEVAPFMLADDIRSFGKSERNDYRQTVAESGLRIVGLHWLLAKTDGFHLTSEDRETRKRTADYFCDLVELCRDLGGDVMVLGSPQQRNVPASQSIDQAFANAAEILSSILPVLREHDVRIALEPLGPLEGNFLNTAAEARQLQQMIADPQIGLHLDVKAMASEALPIEQIIRDHADWLIHFHANDPNKQGPGMGDVDFEPIFAALKEIDYHGWISVEVFDYSAGIEALVLESIANMKSAMN